MSYCIVLSFSAYPCVPKVSHTSAILEVNRNCGKWLMCSINSKGTSFGKKKFGPGEGGARRATLKFQMGKYILLYIPVNVFSKQ